jgi:hypothetical protein
MAQSGHLVSTRQCPLLGEKRTLTNCDHFFLRKENQVINKRVFMIKSPIGSVRTGNTELSQRRSQPISKGSPTTISVAELAGGR